MITSEKFSHVAAQLVQAKKKFSIAKKTGKNTHLKNTYATLDDVLEALTPSMKEHDLMVIQSTMDKSTPQMMYIETMILHSSGEFMAFEYQMPIEGTKAQQYGSTTSYGRRYALCAIFGIAQSDDDAEIAKRTASDYKKLAENCDNLTDLQAIHKSAKSALSASEWKIAEDHLQRRKAELNTNTRRGFNVPPADEPAPENVADTPSAPVESKAEDISTF